MKTITPPPALHGSHLRTYEKIFRHPAAHNLAWRDVLSLFTHLGEVAEEPNRNLRIVRNGHTLVLAPPRVKDVAGVEELMKLRHFLDQSEVALQNFCRPVDLLLVVINRHQARLFRVEKEEAAPRLILPYEPNEFFRHAHDERDFFTGKAKPAPRNFFEPVAQELKNAREILIFGVGTGMGSEMEQFAAWLKSHHPELARRIIGTQIIDEHHLTEAQLLALAREACASPRAR